MGNERYLPKARPVISDDEVDRRTHSHLVLWPNATAEQVKVSTGLTLHQVRGSMERRRARELPAPALLPSASEATQGTLVRHGIKVGEVFNCYGSVSSTCVDQRGPFLARAVPTPDNPRTFDLIEVSTGVRVATMGYGTKLWAARVTEGSR